MQLVLLSGGSGSRLWPLSNDVRSKQFLKVLRDADGNACSMVQRVFGQIKKSGLVESVTIATSEAQASALEMQLAGEAYSLAAEPMRRDTMPAILLACAFLADKDKVPEEETVLVAPIDSFVEDDYFSSMAALDESVQDGCASVVLRGVVPTYASEKYGYILPAEGLQRGGALPVESFVEKPSSDAAEKLIGAGALWNCGVFAFRLGFALDVIRGLGLPTDYGYLFKHYEQLPKTSFDYGVLESCDSIAVVPYEGKWSDLGTWNTLCDEMAEQLSGRVIAGEGCDNLHAINELNTPLIVLGISDAVVVATPDGILVSDKEKSAQSKNYVARIAETRPMHETRKWGHYSVLGHHEYSDGSKTIVKTLTLDPGKGLSYQMHKRRAEVWTVVSGRGIAVLDGEERRLQPGDVVKVEIGVKHRMVADPDSKLVVVEVQLGDELIEEDIVRFK